MAELQSELEMRNTDLMNKIKDTNAALAANETEIKNAVLTDGGYQDVDAGLYALQQKRISYTYDAYRFEQRYPEYAPAVIVRAVDTIKLSGLIKGGLISMDALLTKGGPSNEAIATEKPSFAFILRADPAPTPSNKEISEVKKE